MAHEKVNRTKFLFKIIFIIIIIITILSFSTEILFIPTSNNITTPITVLPPSFNSSEEKFLTYLPHSGFHNQHDAFINAIMLSYLTNRTLIMPPILTNYYPPWSTFHSLYNALNKSVIAKKYRKEHCYIKNDGNGENIDNFCDNNKYSKYDNFTMLNWDQLFDLSELKKHVKMVDRGYDFSLDNLISDFNVGENDTYLFIEDKRFEFEFFDNDNSTRQIHEDFEKKFLISDLIKIDKKLLHFASLFHINRIVLENQHNIEFRHLIHNTLIINNSKLLNIANGIIKKLGDKGNYIGLHIRIGDGIYIDEAEDNKILIFNELMNYLLESGLLRNSKKFFKYNLKECVSHNLPIIYLATDANDPRKNLYKFYKNIPCVFTLMDFSKDLENFGNIPSDFDEDTNLKSFYVPIVDLLVTAYGNFFIGTPKSTFSMAAVEINNLYHGKNALVALP
ncbi:hypothetical protein RclHR1_22720001 [Rhizophagus clarus]|uniref:CigA protein n=1 Tax=Rhizophagus clarus TaxID=94130 RepID=A0A2Z6RAN0_9GLOM|nr:hypothetical protein RclHR1_22720001 [Rhizophagus clarus]GES86592.1 CigA protein [Rhizophagus clarus]